ncbi:MAG: PP2C family protein-serine/threonine phosphatase [Bacteroidetes bacterium]|nr:MAG: PP2C family protein-serine/threonine phosphatase [Bacteroidota bacterium]
MTPQHARGTPRMEQTNAGTDMPTYAPRSLALPLLAGFAALLLVTSVRWDFSPKSSVDITVTRGDAERIARGVLTDHGYDPSGLSTETSFQLNTALQQFLRERVGGRRAAELLRSDSVPAHRWSVYFYDPGLSTSRMPHQYRVWLSASGRLIGFSHVIQDTAAGEKLAAADARAVAERYLASAGVDLGRYTVKRTAVNSQAKRTDHSFIYAGNDSLFGAAPEVTVRVQGAEVGTFFRDVVPPQSFTQRVADSFGSLAILSIAAYVVLLTLAFVIIALFLRKYHEGEVGVSTAFTVAALLFVTAFAASLLGFESSGVGVTMGDTNRLFVKLVMMVISAVILYGFLTAMTFAAWSVGESSARHGRGALLSGADAVLRRRFFTVDTAYSVLWGYGAGAAAFGLAAAVHYAAVVVFGAPVTAMSLGGVAEATMPPVYVVLTALAGALVSEIVFRLFLIAWMRERTGRTWPGVLLSALLWSVVSTVLWEPPFGQLTPLPQLFLSLLLGLFLSGVFLRYGLLAAVIANVVTVSFGMMEPLVFSSGDAFLADRLLFAAVMALPLAVAAVGLVRREEFTFTAEGLPAHIRRISERERMAKELEIARTVQMSLLPKENPRIDGYDIAGACLPAFEVGGDYYDFVTLGGNRLGIAIGDVSGKGVPAAIYMTLTKGILQSHAEENVSPKTVLSKVNRLMYRTIERNSFVSMFYAVLDVTSGTVRYARAGHNPVILAGLRDEQREFLTPNGVALGLDEGGVFDSVLEEREYRLRSGDLLVFYTDGFTEARNAAGDDFGESRLLAAVERARGGSASSIVDAVVRETRAFIGDMPQHDDMTMVVVKVG